MKLVQAPEDVNVVKPVKSAVYRPELDTLRFFSFFAVFGTHTLTYSAEYLAAQGVPRIIAKPFTAMAYGGALGVDLFFLLSAFLITDLLLREKETFGQLNISAFYVRRALRIWPLYFTFIALVMMVPAIDGPGSKFGSTNLWAFLFFVGNWSFVFGVLIHMVHSVLGPLWSVSVEEQFYLLWPPIVSRLNHKKILIASAVMALIANIDRVIEIVFFHHSAVMMWPNTLAHLDTFAAGIAIAVLLDGKAPAFGWPARILMSVGGLVCFAIRGDSVLSDEASGYAALFGYPIVVIGCSLFLLSFLGAPIRSRALEYLGKISYGLYVYHMVGIRLVDSIYAGHSATHALLRVILALAVTIVIAAISYAILERPFLLLKKRFTFVESRPA
jgi:peptidoglycan/LPS O-acetylase OafA/YrhL